MNDDAGYTRRGNNTGYYEVKNQRTEDGWLIANRREQPVFDNTSNSTDFRPATQQPSLAKNYLTQRS